MNIDGYLSTLPNFLAYLATSLLLTAAYLSAYVLITPHKELDLIRGGNTAAALKLSGALIGFVVPLASVIAHSMSLVDVALWGFIALLVQLTVFMVVRLLVPDLTASLNANNVAVGGFAGSVALAAGILNAACMTW